MTDPTPQTTTTRDEAVPERPRIEPLLKDGDVVDRLKQFRLRWQDSGDLTYLGKALVDAIVEIEAHRRASAPAPASGGVDAGRVTLFSALEAAYIRGAAWCAEMGMTHTFGELRKAAYDYADKEEKDVICREVSASLSPAATPVSEAGGEAWTICAKLRAIAEDGDISVNDGNLIMRAVALIEALAKPATSPAPVRPIGNQGISDYQREIARNMAEGFAAWNAARQEALPSDEPASSPAGGDVVQTLIDKTEKLIEAADDMGWSCNSSSADQAIREARDAVRAALSQSTSAGRVGE